MKSVGPTSVMPSMVPACSACSRAADWPAIAEPPWRGGLVAPVAIEAAEVHFLAARPGVELERARAVHEIDLVTGRSVRDQPIAVIDREDREGDLGQEGDVRVAEREHNVLPVAVSDFRLPV